VMQGPWQHGGPIHPTTFGAILRDARLGLGRSLQDAERQTRILARHLAALENGEFQMLPSGIYARGFVYNYANWLQLNPNEMVRLFNEARGEPEVVYKPQAVGRGVNTSGPFSPNFVVVIFATLILSVVAAWGYSLIVQSPPKKPIIDVPTVAATPTAISSLAAIGTPTTAPSLVAGAIRIPSPTTGASTTTAPTTATGSAATSSLTTTGTAAASSPTVAATITATPATSLSVTIKANGKSWVEAYVDGDTTAKFKGFINPGDSQDIEAKQTITLIVGAPDYVTYSVNGVDKGTVPKAALQGLTIKLNA
jgi:cytoskeleton protein RodZ